MDAIWRILVVDDQPDIALNNATALNNAANSDALPYSVDAIPEESFAEALARIRHGGFDLLVLDVFDQMGAGADIEAKTPKAVGSGVFLETRAERFLPIIFLTALPDQVEGHENPPFVQVVSKREDQDPFEPLIVAVKRCLDSPFPTLYRRLESHISDVSRRFMIEFVEQNWDDLKECTEDIAHLLMRRLGISFDIGQNSLVGQLDEVSLSEGNVPPIRYYVVPAPDEYRTGDIVNTTPTGEEDEAGITQWRVIMTPSCDLVEDHKKADYVVLAKCTPLSSFDEHKNFVTAGTTSNTKRDELKRLLMSNPKGGSKNRFFYLPAAWNIPDLIVDLQQVTSVPYSRLSQYDKQASLDDPYAAELSNQFHCYLGRVGTPDVDLNAVIDGMRSHSSA